MIILAHGLWRFVTYFSSQQYGITEMLDGGQKWRGHLRQIEASSPGPRAQSSPKSHLVLPPKLD